MNAGKEKMERMAKEMEQDNAAFKQILKELQSDNKVGGMSVLFGH